MTEQRTPATTIRIARAYEGPRHTRLEKIWDCIAEYAQEDARLIVEPNLAPRASHAEVFERMYAKDIVEPNRYLLLTEFDWLPELGGDWLPIHVFEETSCNVIATKYYTRNAETMALRSHGNMPGGWYLLIDKESAPPIRTFKGKPDPANQLADEVDPIILSGEDCYPLHYGVEYPTGTHLFWSRHYHEGADSEVISGVELGHMRDLHDMAVTLWLRSQPTEFLQLVLRRYPEVFDA